MNRTFSVVCPEAMDKAIAPALERAQAANIRISERQRLGLNGLAKSLLAYYLSLTPEEQLAMATKGCQLYHDQFDNSSAKGG